MKGGAFFPPRPSLPPLLLTGLVMWAAAALLWGPLQQVSPLGLFFIAALGSVLAIVVCWLAMRKRAVSPGFLGLLGISCALVALGASGWFLNQGAHQRDIEKIWECTFIEDARESAYGWQAAARAVAEDGSAVKVRLRLPDDGGETLFLNGDTLSIHGAVKAPSAGSAVLFWQQGCAGTLQVSEADVASRRLCGGPAGMRRAAIVALQTIDGAESALVQALVCGYRPPITATGVYDSFKTVGLAHVVAVSGAHLSIVVMLMGFVLRLLRLPFRLVGVVTSVFLIAYVVFAGVPVSAVRAALMAFMATAALFAGRRASALNALGFCMIWFVGSDVAEALSASFALSVGSTLGIVVFGPWLMGAAESLPHKLRDYIVAPLSMTAASSLVVLPYSSALFSQLPLLSPLANLLAAPLFTLSCAVAFALVVLSVAFPPCAALLLPLACWSVAPLQGLVQVLASVPGLCLPVDADASSMAAVSFCLCVVLWAWWPRLTLRRILGGTGASLLLCLLGILVVFGGSPEEIVMLDVGQGDAFLVRSQGRTMLIDTGNQDARLKEALARHGIRRIDAMLISHGDDDHCGSIDAVSEVAVVDEVLVAQGVLSCPCTACGELKGQFQSYEVGEGVRGLSVGDKISCGRFSLTVVWPRQFVDQGGNADSLSVVCQWDGDEDGSFEWNALFCGDAEAEQLHAMADSLPCDRIDVLKVGHHGSRKSLDGALLQAWSPRIALISAGAHNRYGHPAPEICSLLDDAACLMARTDLEGDATVTFAMEKLSVRTQFASEELS